jgi:hypothetical protein
MREVALALVRPTFEHHHVEACLRKHGGRDTAARARADDHHVARPRARLVHAQRAQAARRLGRCADRARIAHRLPYRRGLHAPSRIAQRIRDEHADERPDQARVLACDRAVGREHLEERALELEVRERREGDGPPEEHEPARARAREAQHRLERESIGVTPDAGHERVQTRVHVEIARTERRERPTRTARELEPHLALHDAAARGREREGDRSTEHDARAHHVTLVRTSGGSVAATRA